MSASAGNLSVTITGIDRLSSVFQRISGSADKFGKRMSTVGDRLHRGLALDRLTRGAQGASRALSSIAPAIGVLTAAGTVAGLVRLTDGFATFGAQLGRDASRIRSSVGDLSELQGAARLAGSSAADLTSGMVGLGDALTDAVGGRDNPAAMYFNQMRIEMRGANGAARTALDVLPQVADEIARMGDPALQARVMAVLRLPASLLPFLQRGAAGIEEYRRRVAWLNPMHEAGARAARSFEEAFSGVRMASEGLGNTIAARLEPVLVPLLNRLTKWIAGEGKGFAATIGEIADSFAIWVKNGGLERLGTALGEIGSGIKSVVKWMGGWENAAIALGVVLTANMLAPLLKITGALAGIAAFRMPAWLLRALPLAFVGPAGGEDPEFSRQRNEEWLRNNPRDPNTPAPAAPAAPVLNQFFGSMGRIFDRAFSPRGGDRSVPASPTAPGAPIRPGSLAPGERPAGIPPNLQDPTQGVAAGLLSRFPGARITSGLRPQSNGSQHQHGSAIDLSLSGLSQAEREELVRTALSGQGEFAGVRGIGTYNATGDSLHVDTRSGPFAAWGPNRSRTSLGQTPDWFQRQVAERMARGDGPGVAAPAAPAGFPQPPAGSAAPAASAGGNSRMDVRITLAGPGSEGATITSRSDDGGVRIQRPSLGVAP
jgi:hypothetical protein